MNCLEGTGLVWNREPNGNVLHKRLTKANKKMMLDKKVLPMDVRSIIYSELFGNYDQGLRIKDSKVFVKYLGIESLDTIEEIYLKYIEIESGLTWKNIDLIPDYTLFLNDLKDVDNEGGLTGQRKTYELLKAFNKEKTKNSHVKLLNEKVGEIERIFEKQDIIDKINNLIYESVLEKIKKQ